MWAPYINYIILQAYNILVLLLSFSGSVRVFLYSSTFNYRPFKGEEGILASTNLFYRLV